MNLINNISDQSLPIFGISTDGITFSDSISIQTGAGIDLYVYIKVDTAVLPSFMIDFNSPGFTNRITVTEPVESSEHAANPKVISDADWGNVALDPPDKNITKKDLFYSVITKTRNEYVLKLKNFKITDTPGNYKCKLITKKTGMDKEASILCRHAEKPLITAFKSDRYFIINGDIITLSGEIKGSGFTYAVYSDHEKIYPTEDQPATLPDFKFTHRVLAESGNYSLKAYTDDKQVTISKELYVEYFKGQEVHTFIMFANNLTPVKTYAYNNSLYCIVYNETDKKVYLYQSDNGINNWTQVLVYPDPVTDPDGKIMPVEIDIKIAGSPGLVFKDKLWFIGGSSYSTTEECQNSDIYCFDFADKTISKISTAPFPARMGHTCLLVNGEIWVMGGYNSNSDYGTLNDIWTSQDGFAWKQNNLSIPGASSKGRCMMAASTWNNEIWLYGGFNDEPYGSVENTMYRLVNNKWELQPIPANDQGITAWPAFSNVGLTVLKGKLILFANAIYSIWFDQGLYKILKYDLVQWMIDSRGSLQLNAIAPNYGTGDKDARIAWIVSVTQGEDPYEIKDTDDNPYFFYFDK